MRSRVESNPQLLKKVKLGFHLAICSTLNYFSFFFFNDSRLTMSVSRRYCSLIIMRLRSGVVVDADQLSNECDSIT